MALSVVYILFCVIRVRVVCYCSIMRWISRLLRFRVSCIEINTRHIGMYKFPMILICSPSAECPYIVQFIDPFKEYPLRGSERLECPSITWKRKKPLTISIESFIHNFVYLFIYPFFTKISHKIILFRIYLNIFAFSQLEKKEKEENLFIYIFMIWKKKKQTFIRIEIWILSLENMQIFAFIFQFGEKGEEKQELKIDLFLYIFFDFSILFYHQENFWCTFILKWSSNLPKIIN